MTLSLDTNVLIDLIRGDRPSVREAFNSAASAGEEMVVSVLVAHELRFGAARSRRRLEVELAEAMLKRFPIFEFNEDDAAGATQVRFELERIGLRIGAMDMLIAGHAVARGWSVVTADTQDFDRVKGLRVIDWTQPAETL